MLKLSDQYCWGLPYGRITINNCFGAPFGGYDCGWSNFMGKMMMYQTIGGIFSNAFSSLVNAFRPGAAQAQQQTPMQYAQTFYPYLNISRPYYMPGYGGVEGRGGYLGGYKDRYMNAGEQNDLNTLQNMYSDLYKIGKVGDDYIARDKDGKQIKASSLSELTDKLGEACDANGSRKAEDNPDVDDTPKPEEKGTVKPEEEGEAPKVEGAGDAGKAEYAADAGKAPASAKKKSGKLPDGWYRASSDGNEAIKKMVESKGSDRTNGKKAAYYVANKIIEAKNLQNIDIDKFVKDLVKYNPSVFDKSNNYVKNADFTKLDIPNANYIVNNYTLTKKSDNNVTVAATNGGMAFAGVSKNIAGHSFKQGVQFAGNNGWYCEHAGTGYNGYFVINNHAYLLTDSHNNARRVDYEDLCAFVVNGGKYKFGGQWPESYTLTTAGTPEVKLGAKIYSKNGIAYIAVQNTNGKTTTYNLNDVMNNPSLSSKLPL